MENVVVHEDFKQFGKYMQLVGIFTILTIIPGVGFVMGILILVFTFMALGYIKTMNYNLSNPNLHLFRSKLIKSITLGIIGGVILIISGSILGVNIYILTRGYYYSALAITGIVLSSLALLAGLIIVIVAFANEAKAWENLKLYFEENRNLYPEVVVNEVIEGAANLRTGAILYALFIFVIPVIIGFIFQIVGYFKLAKLEALPLYATNTSKDVETPVIEKPKASEPVEIAQKVRDEVKFCPNCGARIKRVVNYCAECGSPLN